MTLQTRSATYLIALVVALSAGILCYSQTSALDWDEGFHLLAAYVISLGKRPYIDFCFPQTSLHAYWNAFWLAALGRSWRGLQFVASLLTCGALALSVEFVYRRLRDSVSAAITAILIALNWIVLEFGTTAQAYAAGLFFTVAAFRTTVRAIDRRSWLFAALAGMLACISASCSLLTAPAAIVLFLWIAWTVRELKLPFAFLAGALPPLAPVALSFIEAPYITWFNLVAYHIFYRHVKWEGATLHDFETLISWSNSGRALLLAALAAAGYLFLRKSNWTPEQKGPFYLALWLAAGLTLESVFAHPTFDQYFIFAVPFLAILAAPGFSSIVSRFSVPPVWIAAAIAVVLLLAATGSIADTIEESDQNWSDLTNIAAKVAQVTPPDAPLLADPHIYFLLGRVPPSGTEFPASHKLELPPDMAAKLHIMPQSVMERRVQNREFATVETCYEDQVKNLKLPSLYSHHTEESGCFVYWDLKQQNK